MKLEDVNRIAIFGAGTMGPGLAQMFAVAGYDVALYSRKAQTLDRAMAMVRANLAMLVERGTLKESEADEAVARVRLTQDAKDAGQDADFVMETIVENREAKKQLYEQLDTICRERVIFASNTSSLNIFELMPPPRLPHALCAHFFAPAHIIPLVEIVPGPETAPEAVALTMSLMKAAGKDPVLMKKFGPGFIVNRIQRAIGETVLDMIDEGLVAPEEVDQAIKLSLGVRLPIVGVVQTFDFQGLDMLLAYQKNVGKVYPFIEERVEQGALGAKTSRGIYDYRGRSEEEILKKRDDLYLKMLEHLRKIGAFAPV